MNSIPTFLTHYYESEYGPFQNICNLSEAEWGAIIEREKSASTEFNRFAIGKEFFRNRCEADDLLIQLYEEKFGGAATVRPSYATLGAFDRTAGMYRHPRKIELPLSTFKEHEVTFIYEDHFHLGWTLGSQAKPEWFEGRAYHTKLFAKSELESAFSEYRWHAHIRSARSNKRWVSAYVEAHIWIGLEELNQRSLATGGFESVSLSPAT